MYVAVGLLVIAIVLNFTPVGKKGRDNLISYWSTRKVKLDDYDAEQKNIDKLSK